MTSQTANGNTCQNYSFVTQSNHEKLNYKQVSFQSNIIIPQSNNYIHEIKAATGNTVVISKYHLCSDVEPIAHKNQLWQSKAQIN